MREKTRDEQLEDDKMARVVIATLAMQGILANPGNYGALPQLVAQDAVQYADALIKELDGVDI